MVVTRNMMRVTRKCVTFQLALSIGSRDSVLATRKEWRPCNLKWTEKEEYVLCGTVWGALNPKRHRLWQCELQNHWLALQRLASFGQRWMWKPHAWSSIRSWYYHRKCCSLPMVPCSLNSRQADSYLTTTFCLANIWKQEILDTHWKNYIERIPLKQRIKGRYYFNIQNKG